MWSRALILVIIALVVLPLLVRPVSAQTIQNVIDSGSFAAPAYQRLWARTDAPVAAGSANRSWVWGERAADWRYERYTGSPSGVRLVQYFDKARMEINDPGGDRSSPWFVTNGLLVVELISGRVQVDAAAFEERAPADVPIAGDPTGNPDAPTYAMLAPIATLDGGNAATSRVGQRISATYGPDGVGDNPDLAVPETEIVRYEPATGHNVPRVFEAFMNTSGTVLENGRLTQSTIVDPLFAFGYPITEPYWTTVNVGGEPQRVLFQAFQRRVLTYNPANPEPWQVEMGNVGQHYLRWRYGHGPGYAQPALADGVVSREITIDLPTYGYEQALVPTEPGDPIYPYQRLDPAQVGPPQMRSYRAVVIENRFLELTFLPELGGRLYRAVNKATGQNMFYQNPVVKPSPFGQRGWWLGVGGLEWAAPTEEHGYLENLPWELTLSEQDGGMLARMTTTERQTGMGVTGEVLLPREQGAFDITMSVSNGTDTAHPLQMWTNAMLAPGAANHIGTGAAMVVPTENMIIHATEDSGMPGPGEWITWPRVQGRDLRYPANWDGYVGAFAPQPVPFFGIYDTQLDAGTAIVQGPGTPGAKIFAFSDNFDRGMFTDDGSDYAELWSGAQPTFWDYPPLEPGATRTINSRMLPLRGLGMLAAASDGGALGVQQRADGGTTVALASARVVDDAVVVVRLDGQEVFRAAALQLRPDLPLAIDLPLDASGGQLQVEAPGLLLETP